MNNQEDSNRNKEIELSKLPTWVVSLAMLFIFLIIAGIIYLQFIRYYLVGVSITRNDLTSSAMLLSPEIAAGISTIVTAL